MRIENEMHYRHVDRGGDIAFRQLRMKNKYSFLYILFWILFTGCSSQPASNTNLALHLDGNDNYISIGMGIIDYPWTLEAWIKGDEASWKEAEALFGGGTFSDIRYVDDIPLAIRNGKLNSTRADLWAPDVLDDQWHHVAVTCDGSFTTLFQDGEMVDRKEVAYPILPDVIGVQYHPSTTFGGWMDEVRIWTEAIPAATLKSWMSKPLQAAHPYFKHLKGYYTFDEGLDDTTLNWVGGGVLSYHAKNYRNAWKERLPLAYTAINDNPAFENKSQRQQLFNAVVIDSEWDSDLGEKDEPVLKLRIAVTGDRNPLRLTELTLDLSESTSFSDLTGIRVYHAGSKARSGKKTELFGGGIKPENKIILKAGKEEALELSPGINYLLVTADVSEEATPGNIIKISIPSFKLNGESYTPEPCMNMLPKQITENSRKNPNMLRVLQWNIWVGGVFLGDQGLDRTIEVIRKVNPDVITMQEGYGSQHTIAEALGYYIQTPSADDNLVLLSRYPIEKLPSSKTFYSNPGIITLPNGRRVMINSCWLRYASEPEYTGNFPDSDHNTDLWIAEDSAKGLADISHILTYDVIPVMESPDMPVIIGGDFNSCSHLDWTAAAAHLHYGYGPVNFPISRYMLENGYKDSFRDVNPDEVERPEGTYGVIFGQLQNSRIDFLYYKGKGIRAVNSKIVRTNPEIDYVWTSDHDAVVTDYEILPE